jgi:hAT family C-terminal dimerisation region
LQTNKFGSIAYSFMLTYRCYNEYVTSDRWYVADVDKLSNSASNHWWHGGAKFPLRDYGGKPIETKTPSMLVVKMKKHKKKHLTDMAAKLIERIEKEFRQYGGKPRPDQLLAIMCNPISATIGLSDLQFFSKQIEDNPDPAIRQMAGNFKDDAIKLAFNLIEELCSEKWKTTDTTNAKTEEPEDDMRPIERARLEHRSEKRDKGSKKDRIMAEIKEFLAVEYDWTTVLLKQGLASEVVAKIGSERYQWMSNWEKIAELFDVMKWWERQGKKQFPLLYIVACIVLPLPESNGSQERTFSTATWMDGKLNNRQSEETFQMKVVLHQNLALLKKSKIGLKEEYKKKAALTTEMLIKEVKKFKTTQEEQLKAAAKARKAAAAANEQETGDPVTLEDTSFDDEIASDEDDDMLEIFERRVAG